MRAPRPITTFFLLLLSLSFWPAPGFAAEVAELRNGFTIPHCSREVRGGKVRLYTDDAKKSFVDISADEIQSYSIQPDPEPVQLMPGTAAQLGVADSFSPEQNVNGGARYLRELLERYHGDAIKALAAYNAGPGAVDRYRGVPPYRETRLYVQRIVRQYNSKKQNGPRAVFE